MTHEQRAHAMEAGDATMLLLEGDHQPFHTLKIALLDTHDRARPVTLDEIAAIAPDYLSLSPRLTQRVERRGDRRWYWVEVPDLVVGDHLAERTVSGPAGLDALCGELAAAHLDRSRPLWHLTLVHGLPEGQQAVVVRIHHAVMDGSAAMNAFTALSSDTPGVAPSRPRPSPGQPDLPEPLGRRLVALGRAALASRRRTLAFGPRKHVPSRVLPRTSLNVGSQADRVCASRSTDLRDLKEIAALTGVNTMAVVHAAIAQAVRDHLLARGESPTHPLIANFGVNEDRSNLRCDGNRLATARVWLHVEDDVPLSLLAGTARSCRESVALRRARGFELQLRGAEFTTIIPPLQKAFLHLLPRLPIHLLTAYVVGPNATRWCGDVKVAGFLSYAVSVSPFDPSITAYTYAGRLWWGVVTQPAAIADPARFLDQVESAVQTLLVAARASDQKRPGPRVPRQRSGTEPARTSPRPGPSVLAPPILDTSTA